VANTHFAKCNDIGGVQNTDHADDHAPQRLPLYDGYILENVAAGLLQQFKRDGQVMVLKHRLIIVH